MIQFVPSYVKDNIAPAIHDVPSVVPTFVVPLRHIDFAPVEFTFNVGFDAVFEFVIFTCTVTPVINVSNSASVTTFAAVDAPVLLYGSLAPEDADGLRRAYLHAPRASDAAVIFYL